MKTMIHKIQLKFGYDVNKLFYDTLPNAVTVELIHYCYRICRPSEVPPGTVFKIFINTDLYNLTTETPHDS